MTNKTIKDTPENIEKLKNILNDYTEICLELFRDFKKKKIGENNVFLLNIIERFYFNSLSLIPLLELFIKEPRYKLSIALILRTCLSDLLTAIYLITFKRTSKEDSKGFSNEVKALSLEYVKAVEFILKQEHHFVKIHDQEEQLKNHYTTNHEYYKLENQEYKPINIKEIRSEGSQEYFSVNDIGQRLTEKAKYERILNGPLKDYGNVYLLYRFYSQYEHISPKSRLLLNFDSLYEFFRMIESVAYILDGTIAICQVISAEPSFQRKFEALGKQLNKIKDNA